MATTQTSTISLETKSESSKEDVDAIGGASQETLQNTDSKLNESTEADPESKTILSLPLSVSIIDYSRCPDAHLAEEVG